MSEITQFRELDLKSGQITKMDWSPNGRLLAAPTESGSTLIVDIKTELIVQTLKDDSPATTVAWQRSSEYVLTGLRDGSAGLWDLKTGSKLPFVLERHKSSIHSIQWTDEGGYLVTCSLDRFRALDGLCLLPGWTPEMEDKFNERNNFTAAACSHNSTFLFATAPENGSLLVLASLMWANPLGTRTTQAIECLTWSPQEDLLALGGERSIQLFWANQEGFEEKTKEFKSDAAHVYALAFSPDGKLLASRDNQGLKIWDVASGKSIVSLSETSPKPPGKLNPGSGIAFHPDLPLLATVGPRGSELRILDLDKLA